MKTVQDMIDKLCYIDYNKITDKHSFKENFSHITPNASIAFLVNSDGNNFIITINEQSLLYPKFIYNLNIHNDIMISFKYVVITDDVIDETDFSNRLYKKWLDDHDLSIGDMSEDDLLIMMMECGE